MDAQAETTRVMIEAIDAPKRNVKRTYQLGTYVVEIRPRGYFYKNSYRDDDWHGPYSSAYSVSLMIARALRKELVKRDAIHALPE
jgi:hypothetical protein